MKGDGSGVGGRGLLIASIAFIFIVGAIFFAISGGLFSGSGNREADTQVAVTDIFVGRSTRMTVEGPIVANEDRESYRIEVSMDARSVEALKGYDSTVAGASSYGNNRQAYTDFVYALSRAGFDKARTVTDEAADERGVCATGKQYIFEILDNGRSLSRLWATTCPRTPGTLDVNAKDLKTIKTLFDRQAPRDQETLNAIRLR